MFFPQLTICLALPLKRRSFTDHLPLQRGSISMMSLTADFALCYPESAGLPLQVLQDTLYPPSPSASPNHSVLSQQSRPNEVLSQAAGRQAGPGRPAGGYGLPGATIYQFCSPILTKHAGPLRQRERLHMQVEHTSLGEKVSLTSVLNHRIWEGREDSFP